MSDHYDALLDKLADMIRHRDEAYRLLQILGEKAPAIRPATDLIQLELKGV